MCSATSLSNNRKGKCLFNNHLIAFVISEMGMKVWILYFGVMLESRWDSNLIQETSSLKITQKMLLSEPSFDNLACIFPISFQIRMGKANVEVQRNMPHIFRLQAM